MALPGGRKISPPDCLYLNIMIYNQNIRLFMEGYLGCNVSRQDEFCNNATALCKTPTNSLLLQLT
jgi:hypothetical protein